MGLLQKIKARLFPRPTADERYKKISYAQSGEDIIIKYIFDALGVKNPSYIDIGAHHPFYLNNTFLFYINGSRGVNIEPDPTLFHTINIQRPNDVNLNIGISDKNEIADFYVMASKSLNTFSKVDAEKYELEGEKIEEVKKLPIEKLEGVIQNYCGGKFPDFISIDVEGLDELIIKNIDYERNKPKVICIETISFSNTGMGIKNNQLINFIISKGYLLYADTNINSIFVLKDLWQREVAN
jgi:FkbM family methyltransferase